MKTHQKHQNSPPHNIDFMHLGRTLIFCVFCRIKIVTRKNLYKTICNNFFFLYFNINKNVTAGLPGEARLAC